jgi:hypothetical protein
VIDAQCARVAHVRRDERAESGIAVCGHRVRNRWWQAPVLSCGGERIGRRADRSACRESLRLRPGLGAIWCRTNRQVPIEAEVEPRGARGGGGTLELAIGKPLQIGGKADRSCVTRSECADFRIVQMPQAGRPALPRHSRMRSGDGLEASEALERAADGRAKALELDDQRVVPGPLFERREASVQHRELCLPDAGVIDVAPRGEGGERLRGGAAGCARSMSWTRITSM